MVQSVPIGLISVMPQACTTSTPKSSSKARRMASGTAEPPMMTRLRVEGFSLFSRRNCVSMSHTVGTAADSVTCSLSSNSYTDCPSSLAPGMTILQPAIGQMNVSAQALAWNIGTMGSTTSRARRPNASPPFAAKACSMLERCE